MGVIGQKNMSIADTGFWVAFANQKDKHHQAATTQMQNLLARREYLITTCAVMTETCHLLLRGLGQNAQQRFMEDYRLGGFRVFELREAHAARITELMDKYGDLPMDLADASLVILAEELGHGRILSTDRRDFQTYRWKNRHPFENLLLD